MGLNVFFMCVFTNIYEVVSHCCLHNVLSSWLSLSCVFFQHWDVDYVNVCLHYYVFSSWASLLFMFFVSSLHVCVSCRHYLCFVMSVFTTCMSVHVCVYVSSASVGTMNKSMCVSAMFCLHEYLFNLCLRKCLVYTYIYIYVFSCWVSLCMYVSSASVVMLIMSMCCVFSTCVQVHACVYVSSASVG